MDRISGNSIGGNSLSQGSIRVNQRSVGGNQSLNPYADYTSAPTSQRELQIAMGDTPYRDDELSGNNVLNAIDRGTFTKNTFFARLVKMQSPLQSVHKQ